MVKQEYTSSTKTVLLAEKELLLDILNKTFQTKKQSLEMVNSECNKNIGHVAKKIYCMIYWFYSIYGEKKRKSLIPVTRNTGKIAHLST